MGYAYESFSTIPQGGRPGNGPEGWGGDVNTNVQVSGISRGFLRDMLIRRSGLSTIKNYVYGCNH